jgi:type I restriction enzyme S subunit
MAWRVVAGNELEPVLGVSGAAWTAAEVLSALRLPLAPFVEQSAIAAFLDRETAKIDALVDEQKRLIELLKEKRQAVISHAVTKGFAPNAPMKDSGVEWLGQVPEHWEVMKGSAIGTLFGSELINEDRISYEGAIPYLKISSLAADAFDIASWEWYVREEDAVNLRTWTEFLVFPKRGAAIFLNKVNVVSRAALIDPNLMVGQCGNGFAPDLWPTC